MSAIQKLRQIFTRREKLQILVLLVAILVMSFTQALGIASVLPFIGLVMEPNLVFENNWLFMVYETLNFTSVSRFIIFTGIVMFTLIVISNAVSAVATWMNLHFVWMNNHRLSHRLFKKYLSMPYAYFINQNSSDLSKNILNEVNQLTTDYLLPLLTITTKILLVIFILVMLFTVNIIVSLVTIVFIGGSYAFIYWRTNKTLAKRGKIRLLANKERFKIVNEAFGGIKEVKVMNREHFFLNGYSRASFMHAVQLSWNAVISQLPRFALEAIAFGGIIIFVLMLLLGSGDARQVIPVVSVFAFAGYRLMPALQDIFANFIYLRFNQAVLDRIYDDITEGESFNLEAIKPAVNNPVMAAMPFKKEISLDNITYNYPNASKPVLENINLTINYNSSVAFVGPTGAGKTTLVDIILGLLLPQQGRILVDGVAVTKANLKQWHSNIGYVPQHIYLCDDTLASNIAFGIPDEQIDYAALEKAVRIANIYDFIKAELPDGYQTVVGERGIRLSGGQRQRIGIARALYHDPDIIVFDEATSALDGVTEDAVFCAVENTARLKTIIIISHRLTTVKNCDVLYIIDNGKIVDSGTYDTLLSNSQQFRNMVKAKA